MMNAIASAVGWGVLFGLGAITALAILARVLDRSAPGDDHSGEGDP